MSPIELNNLYLRFRARITIYLPDGCKEVSLTLPVNFCNELAFVKLTNWSYALFMEAAPRPLKFLVNLPPLRADTSIWNEINCLRTYTAHNLMLGLPKDRKTIAFVHRWFKEACGHGTPTSSGHYGACCVRLADKIQSILDGAIQACDLLDDPVDGERLLANLKNRRGR